MNKKAVVAKMFEDEEKAEFVLNALREYDVFKPEGQRKAAKWMLSDSWDTHDHEVAGDA